MHNAVEVTLILLATAVAVVVVFRRLSLPAILGYLLVGAVIGPNALGWVTDSVGQRHLAEFGVVFLMFSIGLEFSLPQLSAMRKIVFGLGGLQVVLTLVLVAGMARLAGLPWSAAVVIGGIASMSSTAIVSRTLAERMQLSSAYGRQTMGVALFQDLAVVPLIVMIPTLTKPADEMAAAIGIASAKAAVVLAIVLFFGQRVMRKLFDVVARQKSSELFVLSVLLVTLTLSFVTERAGLSAALGAFVAGMLISETEYRYQVEDDIKPFRDVLLGLFFITIGMLIDVRSLLNAWWLVLLLLVAFFVIKLAIVFLLAQRFGSTRADALKSGLALAPAGEFGFVLLSLAGQTSVLPPAWEQAVLGASLLSMFAAPLLMMNADKIALYLFASEWESRALQLHQMAMKSMAVQRHVIICGYGRSGQSVARFLEREKIPLVALDADPERVREAAVAGDSVLFGDASRREVLTAAGLPRAQAVVVSFSDTAKALAIIGQVRQLRGDVPVIVRTFDDTDIAKLRDAGAAEIVAEVVEGSLMLAAQTMLLLGLPISQVLRRVNAERNERYSLLAGFFHGATDDADPDDRQTRRLKAVALTASANGVGKSLSELRLDALEVKVTAVRRGGTRPMPIADDLQLAGGDVVICLGTPEQLARAEMQLLQGLSL